MGYHLLARPEIGAAIAAQTGPLLAEQVLAEQVLAEIEIRAGHVLAETMCIAFADLKLLFQPDGTPRPLSEIDADTRAGLATIETEEQPGSRGCVQVLTLRRHDKMEAPAELGRHFGLFDERVELAGGTCRVDVLAEAAKEAE